MVSVSLVVDSDVHFRKRVKYKATDETVIDASHKLTDAQFIAWKFAYLHGMSNIDIADAMSTHHHPVFPSAVVALLEKAAARGFAIPGEQRVTRVPRISVVA